MGRLLLVLFAIALSACSATVPAPIHNDSGRFRRAPKRSYRVLPGDTLYSVAFATGHDYRELARWNGIAPPYRIRVGERLRLRPPARPTPRAKAPARAAAAPSAPPLPARRLPVVSRWIWPARGRVVRVTGRSRPGDVGIAIRGRYGEPVRAAAAGEIVYVGSGLPGYGELIIIKHNNDYLSAYAHNAWTDVQEGEMVEQGEVIAAMGDSGTNHVELGFEIRKDGAAVNPIAYLPHTSHP